MVNPRYRNVIIHEIQIPSIAYDVIYAYNLKNKHFPFNRDIFLLMSHPIFVKTFLLVLIYSYNRYISGRKNRFPITLPATKLIANLVH